MLLVHKIELKPNNQQKTYFIKACGIARFAYNWALDQWKKQYEAGKKPKEHELRKQLNKIKYDEFPWMLEVTKVAPQQAIKNLVQAFKRFFNKKSKYPKFKKKGRHDSFRVYNGPPVKGANAVLIKGEYEEIDPEICGICMHPLYNEIQEVVQQSGLEIVEE